MSAPLISGSAAIARRWLTANSTVLLVGDSITLAYGSNWFQVYGAPKMGGFWFAGGGFTAIGGGAQSYGTGGSGGVGVVGPIGLSNHSICSTWEVKFNGGTTFPAIVDPLTSRVGSDAAGPPYLQGRYSAAFPRDLITWQEFDWMDGPLQSMPVFYKNPQGTALCRFSMRDDAVTQQLAFDVPSLAGSAGYYAPAPQAIAAPAYYSTTLSAQLNAGATTIALTSIAGLVAGQKLYLGSRSAKNICYVASNWNGVTNPVPLAQGFQFYNGAAFTSGNVASGTAVSWPHDYSEELQMRAGTPANNENLVLCGVLLQRTDLNPAMTLIDIGVGGSTILNWNDPTWISDLALQGTLPLLGITDVWICIGVNNPNGQTAAQYQTTLTSLVGRIRTALPNASITFVGNYDLNGLVDVSTGPHIPAFVDAMYAVQLQTSNSLFLNLFAAAGTNNQLRRRNLLDVAFVHPKDEEARSFFLSTFWGVVNQAAWSGNDPPTAPVQRTVTYAAVNTSSNTLVSNDQANHTLKIIADGTEGPIAASPVAKSNGEYAVTLTAAENTGVMMTVAGNSSTPNVVIQPKSWQNPTASTTVKNITVDDVIITATDSPTA